MTDKPDQDKTKSPLDDVRKKIIAAAEIISPIDIDEEDPYIQRQILQFVYNLIERTKPDTRLAYQICHYMESNFLEIDGMNDAFPLSRKEFKKERRTFVAEKKQLEGLIKEGRAELRLFQQDLKGQKKNESPEIEDAIQQQQDSITQLESELRDLGKDSVYKEAYPIKSDDKGGNLSVKPEDWDALKAFFKKQLKKKVPKQDSPLLQNTEMFCSHLGFSDIEREALLIFILMGENEEFYDLLGKFFSGKRKNAHTIFSKILGVEREVVSRLFAPESPLVEKGILIPTTEVNGEESKHEDDDSGDYILPAISNRLIQILSQPDLTIEILLKQFIGEPSKTHLDWDKDFAYLGESGNELIRMLQGAKGAGLSAGVNILLYGLPGTGKTEAVKAAAQKIGLELYMIGEKNSFGREPTRQDRLTAAILAQELLADKPNAAVLLDEMDDLFPAKASLSDFFGQASHDDNPEQNMGDDGNDKKSGGSKVFLNRLLERNKTITFWTANRPEQFDAAFRRRILYSIEFRVPPANVREKIWTSIAVRHKFQLATSDIRQLAASFVAAPGLIDNAIRHASMAGGKPFSIETNLRAASKLLFGNRRAIDARDEVPSYYDPRFIKTHVETSEFDLATLAENIRSSGRRDFNMLLYGPPGTGKTAYFGYLSRLLGMDVLVKDAASLKDKFVGETEKRIAKAFTEAEERGMFLVIDEADPFPRRRDELDSNHEVAAVNTMLTSMERHKQPFGCTTNLFDSIDPAAKRRFLFSVKFDYLTQDQTRLAFSHFFSMDCPEAIKNCPQLVPSDFVNVNKKIDFITGEKTPERLVKLLTIEAKARMDAKANLYAGNGNFGYSPKVA